jgi:hypothetical protein
MEYLNWMADHWLLTIVLAFIVSGAARSFGLGLLAALVKRG